MKIFLIALLGLGFFVISCSGDDISVPRQPPPVGPGDKPSDPIVLQDLTSTQYDFSGYLYSQDMNISCTSYNIKADIFLTVPPIPTSSILSIRASFPSSYDPVILITDSSYTNVYECVNSLDTNYELAQWQLPPNGYYGVVVGSPEAPNINGVRLSVSLTTSQRMWTIMVYMSGDNNLQDYAIADFNEMQNIPDMRPTVEIIVLVDTYDDGAKMYRIGSHTAERISCPAIGIDASSPDGNEINMGIGNVFKEFINCVVSSYPAVNYALILWNHGMGWRENDYVKSGLKGVVFDQNGSYTFMDYLSTPEILNAILSSNLPHISLMGFDACLMGMLEVAYQFKDVADYMVFSEATEPAEGWKYNVFLNQFYNSENKSPIVLGKAIVDSYGSGVAGANTLALVDLRSLNQLPSLINAFVNAAASYDDTSARNAAARVQDGKDCINSNYDEYMDIIDYLTKVINYYSWATDEATDLRDFLANKFILYKWIKSSLSLNGVSIHYPPSQGIHPDGYTTGSGYKFFDDTLWDDFINSKNYSYSSISCTHY